MERPHSGLVRADSSTSRLAPVLAATVAVAAVAALMALFVYGRRLGWTIPAPDGGVAYDLRTELPWISTLTVGVVAGAVLAAKRPRNPIPWLLMVLGVGFISYPTALLGLTYQPDWATYVAWVGNWTWVVGQAGGFYLLLLFPDGRPLTKRWGFVAKAGGAYLGCAFVITAVWPDFQIAPALDNPFGIEALRVAEPFFNAFLMVGFTVLPFLAVVSLVVRFVRSAGVERTQMKWMAFAATSLGVSFVVLDFGAPRWIQAVPTGLVVAAIIVAVTRYRLYEIDRVISRTVTYAVVSLVLVGVYVSGVLGLGTVIRAFTGDGGGDLVVAASTLAVAALFQPVRRRVRTVVDRRFNRSRYDVARTVGSFAARLRDEVDLDVLGSEIRTVADRALRPAHVSLVLVGGDQRVAS